MASAAATDATVAEVRRFATTLTPSARLATYTQNRRKLMAKFDVEHPGV